MCTADQKAKNCEITHHPDQAMKRFRPKSALSLAKLNINVYIMTVGSATPNISNGWPPMIECIIPQRAVDANVWTAVSTPSAWDLFIYLIIYMRFKEFDRNVRWQNILKIKKLLFSEHRTSISLKLFTKWNDRNRGSKEYVCGGSQNPENDVRIGFTHWKTHQLIQT